MATRKKKPRSRPRRRPKAAAAAPSSSASGATGRPIASFGPVARARAWVDDLPDRGRRVAAQARLRMLKARLAGAKRLALVHDRSALLFGRVAFASFRFLAIVTAPFAVLIRGAVWLYSRHGFSAAMALAASGAATLVLLTGYGALVSRRVTGRARLTMVAKWVATPLVVGYCAFALLYVARVNTKDDVVRSVYTATHPLLRVALATLILADHHAVITDLARAPDDYGRMALPVNRRSLHYRQADGWVHAVDLRTRGAVRSVLVEWYFRAMGFDTLRHTGTSDHLHVSLRVNRSPATGVETQMPTGRL